jgi:hypothetical protein
MTGDKEKFHELDESLTGRVKFGDGSLVAAPSGLLYSQATYKLGESWSAYRERHKIIMDGNELVVYVKNPWQLLMKVKRMQNHLQAKEPLNSCMLICVGQSHHLLQLIVDFSC